MTVDELVRNYPRLYHVTTGGSWPTIQRHGLLPTAHIVTTAELPAAQRDQLLTRPRPVSTTLAHPVIGPVTIRDQAPLRPHILATALTDVTVPEWLDLLNGRVFFWLHEDRVRRLLGARRFRHQSHDVLTIDTRGLVGTRGDRIELSPINSGSTLYPNAPTRGTGTFLPVAEYPFAERLRGRDPSTAVTELTVIGGVPDLASYVLGVETVHPGPHA